MAVPVSPVYSCSAPATHACLQPPPSRHLRQVHPPTSRSLPPAPTILCAATVCFQPGNPLPIRCRGCPGSGAGDVLLAVAGGQQGLHLLPVLRVRASQRSGPASLRAQSPLLSLQTKTP